jgi:quercetin dioxygenase-like cupin family protein
MTPTKIESLLECTDLDAMVEFLVAEVGLRIDTISPADDPAEIVLSGPGIAIRVRRSARDVPAHLIVRVPPEDAKAQPLIAPNSTVVEFATNSLAVVVPPSVPSLSIVRASDEFGVGRAGMGYRDILPDRWGGRFIASHILIADGGDVADYVHFHRIRFQMIFCARGWVDVAYEDQGEPMRLNAGDCFLQPPEIRHRVLRSSPGLEVIEVGCPAVHDTVVEHGIKLPTGVVDRERDFGGQRFVHHVQAEADRSAYLVEGLVCRDTGIGQATDGLAGAIVIEATEPEADLSSSAPTWLTHDGEFALCVVLDGSATLTVDADTDAQPGRVPSRDAIAFPAGTRWAWSDWSADFELLQVTLPADGIRRG